MDHSAPAENESMATIAVAIAVNALIAVSKIVAFVFTGSSAMLSEAIHSCVDALNEALLFVGVSRSKRRADATHPLGYGQELYFWTLIVAIVIFGAGGSVAIVEGITRIITPHALENPQWSYGVLGASFVFETVSWVVAYRAIRSRAGDAPTWEVIRESKDPTVFTVLLEDTAALIGLSIALAGTFGQQMGFAYADGSASIGIGAVLCVVAVVLVRESRGLLTGESASPLVVAGIRAVVADDPNVERVDSVVTIHIGRADVLLVVTLAFVPLSSDRLALAAERLRARVVAAYPIVTNFSLSLSAPSVERAPAND